MKLLVDAHLFDEQHQGTRTYLKGLYSELIPIAKDWHFFLVAHDIENLKSEFGNYQNVTYIPLKRRNKFYRLFLELPLIIKKHKIDYAHYQYISPIIKNSKLIITTHDILFEQKEFKKFFPVKYRLLNSFLFKISAKRADVLLTVSNYSKNRISKLYRIDEHKISITPNAASANFSKQNIKKNKAISNLGKYILYVSRIEPRKNHLNLLKAFLDLNLISKGYKIVFIGKKDILFNDLKVFLDQMDSKCKESVVWLENVSNQDLKDYYQNCELFVFPSFAEGFGIPPLEAMLYNKKLLCSNSTAMADFELPEAITFDPSNLEELKLKMKTQLNTSFHMEAVYKQVLSKYNWQTISKDFYKLLNHHYKAY